jgi:hypothetical protein
MFLIPVGLDKAITPWQNIFLRLICS